MDLPKRGLYTSIVPASTAAGLLFGLLLVRLLTALVDHDGMVSYGWRLRWASSGAISGFVWKITPQFRALEHEEKILLFESFALYRRSIIIAFGVTCLNAVGFYTILSCMPTC